MIPGRIAAFAITLTTVATTPLGAQDVARLEVEPAVLSVTSGDTVTFRVTAFDQNGDVIPEADIQGFVNPFSLGRMLPDGQFLAGVPAEGTLAIRSGRAVARVDVTIAPAPPATIEIAPLPEGLAAGSIVPLGATARDRAGNPMDVDPDDFAWMTDDPSVATVDELGALVTHAPGRVTVTVRYRSAPAALRVEAPAPAGVEGRRTLRIGPAPEDPLAIEGPSELRTGEVGRFSLGPDAHPRWFVTPSGASVDADGGFVADKPGTYIIESRLGDRMASHVVTVEPRAIRRELQLLGRGPVTDRLTGDVVVFSGADGRDYAYLGTAESNAVLVYDVTDPTRPVLTDSVTTDARMVLDVKVNDDRTLAVFSREGAATRANGIVLLDLADPAHPVVLSEYTETVGGGVHNTFFTGDHVYATHDGDGALHIIDITDPRHPVEASEWGTVTPGRYLHDLYVQDGIAYLAYWQDGLVILDVGGGNKGGSPKNPVFLGQLKYDATALYGPGGGGPRGTHTVYVEGDRAYVGDEVYPPVYNDLTAPIYPRGYIHVVDVSDPERPLEIARYEVPEAGAHNLWVEDGAMYLAYYQGGARVVDVSGEVRGNLYDQGREIANFITDAARDAYVPHRAFAFGAQLHKGRLHVSDMSSGLWIFEVTGEPRVQYPAE